LLARIRALLRRAGNEAPQTIAVGPLSLDLNELMLLGLPRGPVRLTPLESRFLQLLFVQPGRTVNTERLLGHVWGNRADGNRQLPKLIRTMPSAGYLLDPAAGQPLD
jgi:two-component system OmpR family response regulator